MSLWGRPDGRRAKDLPPERAMFPLIMRGRNESSVYFDLQLDATRLEPALDAWNSAHPEHKATPFHVVVWALLETIERRPQLNRFVAGGRIWDRDGIWVSFAAKARLEDGAPLLTLKRRLQAGRPFVDTVQALRGEVHTARSGNGQASMVEHEMKLMGCLPVFVQRVLYDLYKLLDGFGCIPAPIIRSDPLYTSVFVANLGSIDLDPVFHHLYEHGTASIFCVVGRLHDALAVKPAEPSASGAHTRAPVPIVRRTLPLRFTIDERVCDGLYMHAALEAFRALVEDPSLALGTPPPGGGNP